MLSPAWALGANNTMRATIGLRLMGPKPCGLGAGLTGNCTGAADLGGGTAGGPGCGGIATVGAGPPALPQSRLAP